jgi:hypothetical protein
MRRRFITLVLTLAACAGTALADDGRPAINYISADAVYVNVGSRSGLEAGARITVARDGTQVAVLEVVHVSSHSASCRVVTQTVPPRVGDRVLFDAAVPEPRANSGPGSSPTTPRSAPPPPLRIERRLRGNINLQSVWQRDLDDAGLSSYQPGLSIRLRVADPFGTRGSLRMRHHTRLYHRSHPLSTEPDTDEWSHRLSEFGLYLDAGRVRDAVGFGRVLNPYIRGIGYMDGGYVSVPAGEHYRIGVAAGLDPHLEDSSVQPDRQKYGAFVAYEVGTHATRRFTATLALSGSYDGGAIDREFGYVQSTLSVARRLSLYHSMEIDVNRGWRRDAEGGAVSFSNTYASAHANVTGYLALDASYDARRNIRDYRVHDSPDSLFDDALSTGYNAGMSVTFPRHVRLRARAGVRTREDDDASNRHATVSLSASHFPARGHSVSGRLSVSDTPFVTGYRPAASYRFPLTRRTRVTLGGGAYVYRHSIETTTSGFAEAGVHHTFGNRYFAAGQFRRISGSGLDSITFFAEVGLSL